MHVDVQTELELPAMQKAEKNPQPEERVVSLFRLLVVMILCHSNACCQQKIFIYLGVSTSKYRCNLA